MRSWAGMPHSGSGDAPAVSASPFACVLGYQQQAQLTRRYRLSDALLALVEGGADAPILQMEREVRASMYARLFRWKAGCAPVFAAQRSSCRSLVAGGIVFSCRLPTLRMLLRVSLLPTGRKDFPCCGRARMPRPGRTMLLHALFQLDSRAAPAASRRRLVRPAPLPTQTWLLLWPTPAPATARCSQKAGWVAVGWRLPLIAVARALCFSSWRSGCSEHVQRSTSERKQPTLPWCRRGGVWPRPLRLYLAAVRHFPARVRVE